LYLLHIQASVKICYRQPFSEEKEQVLLGKPT